MIPTTVPIEALQAIPEAIWMTKGNELYLYRGSPLEIVQTMAAEMGDDVTVYEAVRHILIGLKDKWNITIHLPEGLTDEGLSRIFLYAILDRGVGRAMPRA